MKLRTARTASCGSRRFSRDESRRSLRAALRAFRPACVPRHLRGTFLMSKKWAYRFATLAALLVVAFATAGCESKGPAERAGVSIDKGVQNAKDAFNPPGPAEKAGRALDSAVKP